MRSLLVASCLATLAFSFVTPASAGLPPENNSIIPPMIPVVGHDVSGVPDPIGDVEVIVKDLANNPVQGALVVIDFTGTTELRLCADSHDPNVSVDCPTRTVRRLTDATGSARFRVMGWSTAAPGGPGAPYNSAKIYADGVFLGSPSVAIYDLDGGGLGAPDLSRWLSDFFGSPQARDDYDDTESVGASDLSLWLKGYFAGGSTANCTPGGPCP